jgi:hypothetical protein
MALCWFVMVMVIVVVMVLFCVTSSCDFDGVALCCHVLCRDCDCVVLFCVV